MKKLSILFFLLAVGVTMTAQVGNPYLAATNNEDGVVHLEQWQRQAAKPGELLVKFHDRSDIRLAVDANGKCTNRFVSATKSLGINKVLDGFAIASIEQLMPSFQMPKSPRVSKSYGGGDVVEHDLSQWHLIKLDTKGGRNEYELLSALTALDEVEYAEPNYLCFALGAEDLGSQTDNPIHTADATSCSPNNPKTPFLPNDPMYSLQWGVRACNIHLLLGAPKRNNTWRPVIAIIDTGVDVDHPDLAANIWTNTTEANGANNQDDDGNGFRDDIHGWDFVNQTGEMHDFNSHGTHCAGIAGAVTGNGIGIVGACPDALIMPVCVMQSDGSGDIATIVQGINYAAQNGADVISMSIGGYAYSVAMEQALAVAYQTAVLVAAAGNDAKHLDPRCCPDAGHAATDGPMYPGAFTFVLGVQATQSLPGLAPGLLASFSNVDCDGPSYSQFGEEQLYNYELSAPGVGIMSTVPNGGYRNYNGTSMACPLVSGGIASLLQRREYLSKEILFGDLINYSQEFMPVNFWAAYNADSIAPAKLEMVSIEINDTAYGDSSMYADAGERLQLYPTIRTVWGPTDSVEVWLEFQQYEDTNTIHILQNHVQLGRPISSYAKAKSVNPIDIQIDNNVVDGRHIKLTLCASSPDANTVLRHDFTLNVTNGVKLHGVINRNDTLWPNVQYIVTDNFAMPTGCTLYIMPGTTIKVKDGCTLNARIMAIGKPDSMIVFTKTDLGNHWEKIISYGGYFEYCQFEYVKRIQGETTSLWSGNNYGVSNNKMELRNSVLKNCIYFEEICGVYAYKTTFMHNGIGSPSMTTNGGSGSYQNDNVYYYCNIAGNHYYGTSWLFLADRYMRYNRNQIERYYHNNIYGNTDNTRETAVDIRAMTVGSDVFTPVMIDTQYYGSVREDLIRKHINDFETPHSNIYAWVDLSKRASRPSPLAHGIVWKVEVNGYDAQDEFDSIIPLGVGRHEFKVYFNRAMDTSITPLLAMGVRPPYTQTAISDRAYWSADSTIYTAYLNLTGRMPIDGLNRIFVSGAQDNEHFEIPHENQRFNVYVASSGSMSAGFQATPGIGKVDLEWNDQEVNYEDFLGFNLYRYQYVQQLRNYHYNSDLGQYVYDTVTVPGDTIRLNQTLLQDTMYTDYDVVPGERYYYYYKILSTSLTENSPSKTVSCVPNSTIPGDANGSYAVDVADVITVINHITGQNPQPFLFEAADVNGDSVINVLDIVNIINIILHPGQQPLPDKVQQTAIYTVENDTLYINTPVALAGLQFTIANCQRNDVEVLSALSGFECATVAENGSLMMLFYSLTGATVPEGKTALLRLGGKELTYMVLSDTQGHNVVALNGDAVGITGVDVQAQFVTAYPNPFTGKTRLELTVGDHRQVMVLITDLMGRTIDHRTLDTPVAKHYSLEWDATGCPRGVYFATLYADGIKAQTIKLVVK